MKVVDLGRYTYAAIFATQIIQAAEYTHYWRFAQTYQSLFLYAIGAVAMFAINTVGVFVRATRSY